MDDAVGLGAGGDSATLGRKRAAVEAALARAASAHADLDDPHGRAGGAGRPRDRLPRRASLLGRGRGGLAASSLDGLVTAAAALVAVALEPAVAAHLVAGPGEPRAGAPGRSTPTSGLEPLLSLRLRAGEGVGALLAVQLLRTAAGLRAETGRVHD